MPYQKFNTTVNSPCGCGPKSTQPKAQRRYDPRSITQQGCPDDRTAPEESFCYEKVAPGCCHTLDIIQGAGLASPLTICSGRPIGDVRCILPPDSLQFSAPTCLVVGDRFSIGCLGGCDDTASEVLHTVTAISSDGATITFTPGLSTPTERTCFDRGLTVIGCPNPERKTPPTIFLHRDLSNSILYGAIWANDPETYTRRDVGVRVTNVPAIINADHPYFMEGDRVCLPDAGLTAPATVLRTWQGWGDCGQVVYYAELSKPASMSNVCVAAHIEHGVLAVLQMEPTAHGCYEVLVTPSMTGRLPLRDSDRVETDCGTQYHLGKFQIFAVTSYLNGAGQLRDRTEVLACGSVVLQPSFSGMYVC